MSRRYVPLSLAIFGVLIAGSFSAAQVATPLSQPGGSAEREMRGIYRQDVGVGFSSASLNQIALRNAMANVPNVGQLSTTAGPSSFRGGAISSPSSKPFAGFSPEPTTSPYLNLFRDDIDGSGDFNYQTLVRPQLQQQQFNQQLQRQNQIIGQRLQQLSAQPDFNPRGSETQYPTGHSTVFMYTGRYYPMLNVRRSR
jgi:hypothetical protein